MLSLNILFVLWLITGKSLEPQIKNGIIERKTKLLDLIDKLRKGIYNL